MLKAKIVTFNSDGEFVGRKKRVQATYCRNEKIPVIEVSLEDTDKGLHQSIYLDAKSLFKELTTWGVK